MCRFVSVEGERCPSGEGLMDRSSRTVVPAVLLVAESDVPTSSTNLQRLVADSAQPRRRAGTV